MTEAAALAARGQRHGTVVASDTQTQGIGRHGHSWHSESTGGLYLSIILRLPLPAGALPVLTMALGLATQRAVNQVAEVTCDLRWPNDVLLNGRKLAGILVKGGDAPGDALIAGIGVNVNQHSFPPELRDIATSLRIETGRLFFREPMLDRVVEESLNYADLLVQRGKGPILELFAARSSYARGMAVQVDAPGGKVTGVTAGLDENGYLRVQTDRGMETIITGGVRPRE